MNIPRRHMLLCALAAAAPPAQSCEFFSPTLRVLHPWTRVSRDGDTSAVVCMVFDQVLRDDRLVGVETALAGGAEIGGGPVALPIRAGRVTELGERGDTVLRLVGLREPLQAARSYPLRLLFAEGGVVNAALNIDHPSLRFS